MASSNEVLFEGDTALEHYQVVDTVYEGRRARVLYAGIERAPQSGVARDGRPDMLFDYNQRFLELAAGVRPERLLLIGGGCYTLAMALLEALPLAQIDVVERDPGLQDIAAQFFGLKPHKRLHIIHGDGREYADANSNPYDMVLLDAFVRMEIPQTLSSRQAARQIQRNLQPDGVAAINFIAPYQGDGSWRLKEQCSQYASLFNVVEIFPADRVLALWQSQNFIITAHSSERRLADHLRFSPLSLL